MESAPAAPLPSKAVGKTEPQKKDEPAAIFFAGSADDQNSAVNVPKPSTGPRQGEPKELAGLLAMKGTDKKETAAASLRPSAIREAAQLVTLHAAIACRYKELLESTEKYAPILDAAFDFSPLLMTEGSALIKPPVLTRAGASLRIEKPDAATAAETTYELLEPARFVAHAPNWREFLMTDDFPAPETPNPAVLPKNEKEQAIWRTAVRETWAEGLAAAQQLYADNVARMTRQYRGIMLYHLLTAQSLLSKVSSASASQPLNASDSKLYVGQHVYRITAPSRFLTDTADVKPDVKAVKGKKRVQGGRG